MEQQRIWDYFQTVGLGSFNGASGRYATIVATVHRLLQPGARVLNIGIGPGSVERQLHYLDFSVASLDPSEAAVRSLVSAGIDARKGFADSIPFDSNIFDLVIISEVLEHIDTTVRPDVYSEISRVLRRPGWLVGSVPHQEDLSEGAVVCPHCGEQFHRWGHQASFSPDDIRMELSGFFNVASCSPKAFVDWKGATSLKKLVKAVIRAILGRIGEPIASPSVFFIAKAK